MPPSASKNVVKKEEQMEQDSHDSAKYVKLDPLEHILKRPDTYIGSVEPSSAEGLWIFSEEENKMIQLPHSTKSTYVPGLFKIFDEVLVNAADHRQRHPTEVNNIVVEIDVSDAKNPRISVFNDGPGFPVVKHKKHDIMIPQMVMGELLTSSNYNDEEERTTGGRNGLGSKLSSIFSNKLKLETVDAERGIFYSQVWTKNMTCTEEPYMRPANSKEKSKPFTRITFWPELKRFGLNELGENGDITMDLMKRRAMDLAGTSNLFPSQKQNQDTEKEKSNQKKVKKEKEEKSADKPDAEKKETKKSSQIKPLRVLLNGTPVPVKNFEQYMSLFFPVKQEDEESSSSSSSDESGDCSASDSETEEPDKKKIKKSKVQKKRVADRKIIRTVVNNCWEIGVTSSDGSAEQVSFVNGICTSKGGTHVNYVRDQIVDYLSAYITKKFKIDVKPASVRNNMFLFVNALIVNPAFETQTKFNLTTNRSAFGSKCELPPEFLKKLLKTSIVEDIFVDAKKKQEKEIAKTDGKKTRVVRVPKLEDAEWAGTSKSSQCTLIITEGDSAKALAISGLSVVGREKYGVFPLRGKFLNVRDCEDKMSAIQNHEVESLVTILGLKHGEKYQNTQSLRYGKLMLMADQDMDGSHIKGLVINMFDAWWPELLALGSSFIQEFITPILKGEKHVSSSNKKKIEKSFYSLPQYEEFCEQERKKNTLNQWKFKYYKGLGTSTAEEAREYFSNLSLHVVPFTYTGKKCSDSLDLAFGKKRAEDRKKWISRYDGSSLQIYGEKDVTCSFSDFVNKELILYSIESNVRAIPAVLDGLKPSQRKIIYAAMKLNIWKKVDEMKVSSFSGSVSECGYKHGDVSIQDSVVCMAQNFVGANNLPLLYPSGQFGTRLEGGHDAASPRYIFTYLHPLTQNILNPRDEDVLQYTQDEGLVFEPDFYAPIIPLILVNGAKGIGTGWATNIFPHRPSDLVKWIEWRISVDSEVQEGKIKIQDGPPLNPWYCGFKGQVKTETYKDKDEHQKRRVTTKGIVELTKESPPTLAIKELPIGTWTSQYKEKLQASFEFVKEVSSRSTESIVHFIVSLDASHEKTKDIVEKLKSGTETDVDKVLALLKLVSTDVENLVAFDSKNQIHKYNDVYEMAEEHFQFRREVYVARRKKEIEELKSRTKRLENEVRYIREVRKGEFPFTSNFETQLNAFVEKNYLRIPLSQTSNANKKRKNREEASDSSTSALTSTSKQSSPTISSFPSDGADSETNSFEEDSLIKSAKVHSSGAKMSDFSYLHNRRIITCTEEMAKQLERQRDSSNKVLKEAEAKTVMQMWGEELKSLILKLEEHES